MRKEFISPTKRNQYTTENGRKLKPAIPVNSLAAITSRFTMTLIYKELQSLREELIANFEEELEKMWVGFGFNDYKKQFPRDKNIVGAICTVTTCSIHENYILRTMDDWGFSIQLKEYLPAPTRVTQRFGVTLSTYSYTPAKFAGTIFEEFPKTTVTLNKLAELYVKSKQLQDTITDEFHAVKLKTSLLIAARPELEEYFDDSCYKAETKKLPSVPTAKLDAILAADGLVPVVDSEK